MPIKMKTLCTKRDNGTFGNTYLLTWQSNGFSNYKLYLF